MIPPCLLGLLREAAKFEVVGREAFARVLMDWFLHGKFWINDGRDDVGVEFLLLDCLKTVSNEELRMQIEDALVVGVGLEAVKTR